MTVTEAIEIIALDVKVSARRSGASITLTLVEERVSELQYDDSIKGTAARLLAHDGLRQRRTLRRAQNM